MRILVTGGAGFIASHIADAYISVGHDVAILDDLSRGRERNINAKARFYRGDVRDSAFVDAVIEKERPEAINHHAAQMDVRRGVREPQFDASVNILGSLNLLEAARQFGVRRFIYISTAGAAYGEPDQLPVPETCAINPITPYGISKHTIEHYLFTYSLLYGLEYVVLRYGNVYGPRQSSKGEAGVFAIFCEQMLAGKQPIIYGDGTKFRDYVYIEDVARANVLALERGTGEIFNIAYGVPVTDFEVFDTVRGMLDVNVEPQYGDRRPGEIEKIVLNISKAEKVLTWQPKIALRDGAKHTVQWFQEEALAPSLKPA